MARGSDLFDRFISGKDLLALARLHGGVRPEQLERLESLLARHARQPPQRRVQQAALFEQFARVLSGLAQRHPLVLIVDDMQWIDRGSVSLLFHLERGITASRILLVGPYRPQDAALHRGGERHPMLDVVEELQRDHGDICIDLMESEGEAFVEALIDSEPNELDEAFRHLLHRHTAGNPLFTIELLRAMQLRGEIRRSPEGRWVVGPQLNWDELPARVEAVIGRRIGHLSPACQELLGAASVEGEQFTAEVVAEVVGAAIEHVCELLSREAGKEHRLVTAQSVRQVDGRSLSVYRFRHALFQIYLHQHLDVVERARLHGRVGRALEQLYEGSLDRHPQIVHSLARHFESAGLTERAVRYYTRAGKNALRLSAHREALAHFYKALELLERLPPRRSGTGRSSTCSSAWARR
ncbi:MAG: ATP-binding protein [Planctomycetota bacterium]